MKKFFKITMPDGKAFVVTANGYASLIDLIGDAPDKENTYISQMSLLQFVKYVMR